MEKNKTRETLGYVQYRLVPQQEKNQARNDLWPPNRMGLKLATHWPTRPDSIRLSTVGNTSG